MSVVWPSGSNFSAGELIVLQQQQQRRRTGNPSVSLSETGGWTADPLQVQQAAGWESGGSWGHEGGRLAFKQRIHFVFKLVKIGLNMSYVLNGDKTRAEGRKKSPD